MSELHVEHSTVRTLGRNIVMTSQYSELPAPPKVEGSNDEDQTTSSDFVYWGTNNDFARKLAADIEVDTVLLSGLRIASKLLYSGGVVTGKFDYTNGKRDWIYVDAPEFRKWWRQNQFSSTMFSFIYDYVAWCSGSILCTMSQDGKTIARASNNLSRFINVRLGRIDPKTGWPTKAYINSDFGTSFYKVDKNKEVFVAPKYAAAEWIEANREKLAGKSFLWVCQGTDLFRQYYPQSDFNSSVASGWVEMSKIIVIFNKALLENGMNLKWHAEVHPDFWPLKFGKDTWNSWRDEEKVAKMKDWFDELDKTLVGASNASGVFATAMMHIPGEPEKVYSLVKLTALDGKIGTGKEGAYLNTNREASQHKVIALGLDPAIVGALPGDGGMGAGSGSNNRVAFNQRVLLSKSDQDNLIEFFYFLRDVNGWDESLEFTIDQGLITTLDSGAETTKPAAQNPTKA